MTREEIAAAIRLVEGRRFPDNSADRAKLTQGDQRLLQAIVGAHVALSPREREVADLAAAGLSDPAIARRLGISVYTVKQHLKQARLKLGVSGAGQRRKGIAA